MANQLQELLDLWHGDKNSRNWVLGTIYQTAGPCYRKTGAMMLFDDLGRHYGLLSGGCLEADIQRHARRALDTKTSRTLCYDGSDEDDFSFQLGIGCGGTVHILLQPILEENDYLQLAQLRDHLLRRRPCHYRQKIPAAGETLAQVSLPQSGELRPRARLIREGNGDWLETPIAPVPHILIFGAGVDARPMAQLCRSQGWKVSLCDRRPANARAAYFPGCDCYHCHPDELCTQLDLQQVDAAIVMGHNLELDAAALRAVSPYPLRYLGLLGPISRRGRVLQMAGLAPEQLATRLHAPIGLDLGGELPESIALAACAELHAVLHGADGRSLTKSRIKTGAPRAPEKPREKANANNG